MKQNSSILCADIGGSFIDCALVHPDGTFADRKKVTTPAQDLSAFLSALEHLARPYGVETPLHIAIAGLQEPETGICNTANIPCINGTPLARRLAERLGGTVKIGNDADCFTLAEARLGHGKGHTNVLGIILGTGVGGGIVMDGHLVVGAGGLTGEWGHGPVIPNVSGAAHLVPCFPCGCGQKGCIDTIGGARGLERLYVWAGGPVHMDSKAILDAWRAGEAIAVRTVTLYLEYLAASLAVAVNVTGATIVPAGGGLSNAADLLEALDHATRQRILRHMKKPLLVPSSLGPNAGLLGAAFL
ncbi:ROK family protein [Gluconobacter kondonii]|uniref:N-acetylglucosamine kinase n=1 Tax=Gluconobacter kondonii TaxID=941463 RepID=A0ABQ5WSU5_9PROT|nr:ROK family protein [Gluconobacter kondonii]MCP1237687.1 ROK family protein [Gluconobacter kondonii]GBR29975.1 ROK family protein [Gluconobacter kondonii NBRC 3266]GLQ66626.1 N-acetylglucosamine kinase [Gluconobacter kondonii]